MTLTSRTLRRLQVAGLLLALMPSSSFALEAEAVAERLKKAFASQNLEIAWTSARADGDSVTLEGVTAGMKGAGEKLPVGQVVLEDITEENGGYVVGRVGLPTLTSVEDEVTLEATGIEIAGLELPEALDSGDQPEIVRYDSARVERMSFTTADTEVFVINEMTVEVQPSGDNEPIAFTGGAESLSADLTKVLDARGKAVMDALGYTTFEGSMELAGSWSPVDGRSSMEQFDLTIDNAGTLGMSMEMSGYTPQFIKAMQDLQAQAAQPGSEAEAAQGMAMLGLMQQLTFVSAEISFEDDSFTSKVLDFLAKQQGVKPEDIANQAKAMLPFVLAQLKSPEFSAKVAEAVSAYLDNPQNITISAQPAAPVPAAMIAAGAMTAPESLIGSLNVTVTANE